LIIHILVIHHHYFYSFIQYRLF